MTAMGALAEWAVLAVSGTSAFGLFAPKRTLILERRSACLTLNGGSPPRSRGRAGRRFQEVCIELRGGDLAISEHHVVAYAALERLSATRSAISTSLEPRPDKPSNNSYPPRRMGPYGGTVHLV